MPRVRIAVLTALLLLAPAAGAAAVGPPGGGGPFPDTIALPESFFPEGIAIDGRYAFVGSLVDGAIQVQDLRTGESDEFASAPPGGPAIAVGMDVDSHGRLWVAGGGPALDPALTPGYRVYDTTTGDLLADVPVAGGFINDVIVTDTAAWLTDSFVSQLIRVPIADDGALGAPEVVALSGDWEPVPQAFNANGIVATPDGRRLVLAQSTAPDMPGSALYVLPADIDAAVLEATRIALDDTLAGADGLVLVGRTLYSVAGPPGVVEIRLNGPLTAGSIIGTTPVPDSVTPTTADVFGSSLYVVDAKFPLFGQPGVPFHTTAIDR